MNQFIVKFNKIFIPFLLLAVATVTFYTFLHWLFFIKATGLHVDEFYINFVGPMIFPGIPVLIWLRPRIKLLNLTSKNKRRDPLSNYIMLAWVIIIIPTVIAQEYIVTATGKLTKLDNISQIDQLPATKYYTATHFFVDKKLVRPKSTFEVSGKYNDNFDMTLYAPCPIFDKEPLADTVGFNKINFLSDTSRRRPLVVLNGIVITHENLSEIKPANIASITVLKGAAAVALYGSGAKYGAVLISTKTNNAVTPYNGISKVKPVAWIAIKYQETISNKLPEDRKQDMYKMFVEKSQRDFNSTSLDDFYYLDRLNYSKDLRNYQLAVTAKDNQGIKNDDVIILSPVYEPFEARNGNKLQWILGSLGIGSIVFMICLLFKPLKSDALNIDVEEVRKKDTYTAVMWIKGLFIPKKNHFGTQILIEANLLIFIIMVFAGLGFISFNGADLLKWGANYRPSILNGEYWRLITNIFLHGGLMHVLFNMYGLFFVGIFLEPAMGTAKYILVYLITGIIASIASVWWHVATVSVGASGAIFGLYGVFFALLTVNVFSKDLKKSFLISTSVFIVYNLIYGLTGGIDNAAHIGGLLSGLIIGYIIYPTIKNKINVTDQADDAHQRIIDELTTKSPKSIVEQEME
jgi:rhomboid protease GluP